MMENASVSGLEANFLAIASNGGASVTSLRWVDETMWQGTQRISARRLPLSASAASAPEAATIAGSIGQKRRSCTKTSLDNLGWLLACRRNTMKLIGYGKVDAGQRRPFWSPRHCLKHTRGSHAGHGSHCRKYVPARRRAGGYFALR